MRIEDLAKVFNTYGAKKQLKHYQSEVYEFTEAVIEAEYQDNISIKSFDQIAHIAEEMADMELMMDQFKLHYGITQETINEIKNQKLDRQLTRIAIQFIETDETLKGGEENA